MSEDIKIRIPRELVELSGLSPTELEIQSHLLLIFELYQQGKISLSRAAELDPSPESHFFHLDHIQDQILQISLLLSFLSQFSMKKGLQLQE